jgi:hypothetical protein
MSYRWQAELGEHVHEAAVYYDDGDNPIASEGPSSYERSEQAAEAFARARCAAAAAIIRAGCGTPRSAAAGWSTRSATATPTTTRSSRTPTGRARCWRRKTSERARAGAGTGLSGGRSGASGPPPACREAGCDVPLRGARPAAHRRLKQIATVLDQTRPHSILVARGYVRELGQLGALLAAQQRRPIRRSR